MKTRSGMTATEIGRLFGVTGVAIGLWHKAGCPRGADAKYDLQSVISWRLTEVQSRAEAATPMDGKFTTHQLRRQQYLADLTEIDLKKRRGDVLDRDEFERTQIEIAKIFRSRLLAIPREMATRLQGMDQAAIEGTLKEKCNSILRELSS
jgi:phage terminase Nu1 subunit (DNA packaging protein)